MLIRYPEIDYGPQGLAVEVRDDPAMLELAGPVQDLTQRAFTRQLEVESDLLPSGYFNVAYGGDRRQFQIARAMEGVLARGGQYAVVYAAGQSDRLAGLASVSPIAPDRCYIADVAADPPARGIGSAALHAVLSSLPDAGVTATLETVQGDKVTKWYERLGFTEVGLSNVWRLGSVAVPLTRFVSTGTVGDVVQRLEDRHPALRNARYFPVSDDYKAA